MKLKDFIQGLKSWYLKVLSKLKKSAFHEKKIIATFPPFQNIHYTFSVFASKIVPEKKVKYFRISLLISKMRFSSAIM